MSLRKYRLDEAFEATNRIANLRRPQREAFEIVHALVTKLDEDIPKLSHARMAEKLRNAGYGSAYPQHFHIQLATGVGKTRLMGCIAHYLFHARQTKNILIVAPRVAILEKLEREASPVSAKYLLIDPALGPRVNLCTRGNIDAYRASETMLNVFLLSPQTLTSENGRFSRPDEYRGYSLREYLRTRDDLVIFADEAHHLRASEDAAWSASLRELQPKLWFGLTATPEQDAGELLYRYDLAECLRDGLFTKSVKVWVEQRQEGTTDEEWDRLTVEFSLRRLARKKAAIEAWRDKNRDFPAIEPVMLLCAKDTKHAEEVGRLLKEKFALADEEILITHSERAQSEKDVARLIAIDTPGNRIRAVVNVFQLTEGWDVTNVYVIAPLRAMATFEGAVQSMGRGLRLPAGQRTSDSDLDSLDAICFGRAALGEIVRNATERFGGGGIGAAASIDVASSQATASEDPIADSRVEIAPSKSVRLALPRLETVLATPSLAFEVEARDLLRESGVSGIDLEDLQTSTAEDAVSLSFKSVVHSATMRILAKCRYLDPLGDAAAAKDLVERFLISLGAERQGEVKLDPVRLAIFLGDQINKRYSSQEPCYRPTELHQEIEFGGYSWLVPTGREHFLARINPDDWTRRAHRRLPFEGWRKGVYQAAAFDTGGEYRVASILDADADVLWWVRNDPAKLRIPTPAGNFEPDFVIAVGTGAQVARMVLLEVKGGFLWEAPDSSHRIKAAAAKRWATTVDALSRGGPPWSVIVVLDEDIQRAASFGQLLDLNA